MFRRNLELDLFREDGVLACGPLILSLSLFGANSLAVPHMHVAVDGEPAEEL